MKIKLTYITLFVIILVSVVSYGQYNEEMLPVIVVHGGAGVIKKDNIDEISENLIRAHLEKALDTGYYILNREDGTAMQAVKVAINVLEDSPWFNAGKGAVYNSKGEHELDASIMDGSTQNAGAVTGVKYVKNPINAAIEVMNHSPHVFLSGPGADVFARERGLEMVENRYFDTPRRRKQWEQLQQKENAEGRVPALESEKYGTVGAVAVDRAGNIVAGTSTGGTTNKQYGRIGDSPVIGAGTYANNNTCGVSCTGKGEFFIRGVVAYDVSAMMAYQNVSLAEAANTVIIDKLTNMGGRGGLIAIDNKGNVVMVFNTEGMYRGYKNGNTTEVMLYKSE